MLHVRVPFLLPIVTAKKTDSEPQVIAGLGIATLGTLRVPLGSADDHAEAVSPLGVCGVVRPAAGHPRT